MKTSYFFLAVILVVVWFASVFASADDGAVALFTRFLAVSGLFLLSLSLAIGPLALISPKEFAPLIEARRAVGVAAFIFVFAHIFVIADPYFKWNLSGMVSTNALVAGMAGFVIMVVLTVTSTDYAIKTLGVVNWKWVQRLTYVLFVVALYHAIEAIQKSGLDAKGNMNSAQMFVVAFAGITIALQAYGFYVRKMREVAAKNAALVQEKPPAAPQ